MNLEEMRDAVKYMIRTCNCTECKSKFKAQNIHVLAANSVEAFFELSCHKCNAKNIVSLVNTYAESKNEHRIRAQKKEGKISENDILDLKNFLDKFDGNFKKIFNHQK